jgi:hypothetical protein
MRDLFFRHAGGVFIWHPVPCCHAGKLDSGSTRCRNDVVQVMLLIPGMNG